MEGDLKRNEAVSPMAGKTPSQEMLVDITGLEREYFERLPDVEDPTQLVSFGTSGHRGSSLRDSFNEAHILAISQASCDYRHRAHSGNARREIKDSPDRERLLESSRLRAAAGRPSRKRMAPLDQHCASRAARYRPLGSCSTVIFIRCTGGTPVGDSFLCRGLMKPEDFASGGVRPTIGCAGE